MGAYENPALIQDRSGEFIAQGIAAFGQGIAAGLNTYTQKVEARRKEAATEAKARKQREDAINLAGIKAYDDWSKGLRDKLPKDATELAFQNVENFIQENADGYLDAYKRRALAETSEERSLAQKDINRFNELAGKKTQATANLSSALTEVGDLSEDPNAVFFSDKDQVAFKMLKSGLALDGFQDLNIVTTSDENGDTILKLTANTKEDATAILEKYGLNPEDYKDGKLSFELNLNKFRTDSYVAKGFDVKDFVQAGQNTGLLDSNGQLDTSAIVSIKNAAGREMKYYNATGYLETVTCEVEAQTQGWFSGDPADNAQMRATLKKMGYTNDEIKNAIDMGVTTADVEGSVADLYRDNILGKIKNTQTGIADKQVIRDIEQYNKTVSKDQQVPVPLEGDLYLYSGGELEEKTTTTTTTTDTEGQIERNTAEYQLSKMMGTNLSDPEYFIDYYKEAGSSEYGTPMRGSLAFDTAINAKKPNGELDEQYDDYRAILAEQGREAAEQKFKEDKGIAPDDILIVDKSGAIKNRVNVRNKKSMYESVLRSQGISAKNITTILTKFEKNAMNELREQYPDEDYRTLELIFKGQYW